MAAHTVSAHDLSDKELQNLANRLADERGLSSLEVELLHRWRREVEYREAKEEMARSLMDMLQGVEVETTPGTDPGTDVKH